MNHKTPCPISSCDASGAHTPLQKTDNASFSFRHEPLKNGYACYISASSENGFSADEALTFSIAQKDTSNFLAIENHSPFWCRPFWGNSLSELPKRTQELLIRDGDHYICYLPVVADTYKTLIRGADNGFEFYLYANTSNLTEIKDQLSYICMEGTDPLTLLDDIARVAAKLLGNGLKMRSERTVSEIFDYFGWCSWDALRIRVSHDGLMEKVREFQQKKIPVGFAIIDDMWADVPPLNEVPDGIDLKSMVKIMHASKLRSFRGDPKRFPQGMKGAIDDMKHAGIPYVGVWFPTTGYWSGLEPNEETAETLKELLVVTEETGQLIVAPETEKATAFFEALCTRVKDWGGDFVKIDNQGFHTRYKNLAPIGKSAHAIQTAIDTSTEKIFDGALINCMGMPSECMFHRPTSAVSRCSDDFSPESRPWFAKNILQCSYNGLLQGRYYVNDWDMWWTDDEQAQKNSLCRAVSGGPIYVSDEIGRTRPEILRPLLLQNGKILRCDESATPTPDCLLENPTKSEKIFKIRNRVGKNAVAAVFNINENNRPVSGTVSAKQLGLPNGEYVWYEYFSKECGAVSHNEAIEITLSHNDEFRLYTFVPKKKTFTVLGRTDLFIGVKAVEAVDQNHVTLLEGGEISVYSDAPIALSANGEPLPTTREGKLTRAVLPANDLTFTVQ